MEQSGTPQGVPRQKCKGGNSGSVGRLKNGSAHMMRDRGDRQYPRGERSMTEGADILARVCGALDASQRDKAAAILSIEYPFTLLENVGRRYSEKLSMRVFARDGFIDRYTGSRLVFPGTLRLLSKIFPKEFPFHKNWKTDKCHFAFYELFPTIDHLVPVSRGGADCEDNWVSTSMVKNAAKANFTIEELGWHLHPFGHLNRWDGLTRWCLSQIEGQSDLDRYLLKWAEAAQAAGLGAPP